MRKLSTEFQAHLQQDCTELCWVWVLQRTDGITLGFTDHDTAIEFLGTLCEPSGGFNAADTDESLGLAADVGAVSGLFQSDQMKADDIANGLYAGAVLKTYRVVWSDPSIFGLMSTGYLADIEHSGDSFTAEWRGLATRLDRSTGRVFSRHCDAEFGDDRCGLNASDFPEGTICPRTLSACRDQFSNSLNYRGFPYLLGDDAMIAGPREGDIRNGGSRYS